MLPEAQLNTRGSLAVIAGALEISFKEHGISVIITTCHYMCIGTDAQLWLSELLLQDIFTGLIGCFCMSTVAK